jgi:NAD-dependent dihydropyrimidine dehydrogenase PreA subunit
MRKNVSVKSSITGSWAMSHHSNRKEVPMASRTKIKRNIVKIDEEKCNGCGVCVPACAEGAIQIIDGKAKLVSEKYCDGLGACLGKCPQDAITVEEQEVEAFDEQEAKKHIEQMKHDKAELPCGCASATVTLFATPGQHEEIISDSTPKQSLLAHWPVQLTLVPPAAPFLDKADLLLVADCVPFAYAGLHRDFIKDHAVLVACPKLDNFEAHLTKLTEILRQSMIKSLTVLHMEVPCCSGLVSMAKLALQASGREIPLKEITIGIRGEIKSSLTGNPV